MLDAGAGGTRTVTSLLVSLSSESTVPPPSPAPRRTHYPIPSRPCARMCMCAFACGWVDGLMCVCEWRGSARLACCTSVPARSSGPSVVEGFGLVRPTLGTDTPTANGPNLTPSVVVCLVGAVWAFFCRCAAIFLSLCCIFFLLAHVCVVSQ